MRQLILFRHAKAEPAGPADDHGRALSPRGRADAAEAGRWLADTAWPQLALVSDARRTRETIERVADATGRVLPVRFEASLYGAEPKAIAAVVTGVDRAIERLLVVGHNPGLGMLARALAATGDAADRARLGARFPTSACAVIELPWSDWAGTVPGRLAAFEVPGDERVVPRPDGPPPTPDRSPV